MDVEELIGIYMCVESDIPHPQLPGGGSKPNGVLAMPNVAYTNVMPILYPACISRFIEVIMTTMRVSISRVINFLTYSQQHILVRAMCLGS